VTGRRLQICFFFNAQRHQMLHGLSTAVALARMPGFDVYVVSPAQSHIDYARTLAERLGGAPIIFVHSRSRVLAAGMKHTGSVIPPKLLSLTLLARWLNRFDAIALPERTSILLKKLGVSRPRFIHLDHGAGDRAAGFDRRIRQFDFVLMAGAKHRERLMGERLIGPQAHAVVGYPKFEAADAIRDPDWNPFDNGLPIVLYNPHFSKLGSWRPCAEQVLSAFAAQDRYNLILAPHVRLLDGNEARERWGPLLDRFEGHPRIYIDRGSDRAIDMTYTMLADLYLGDVSSQVYEYLRVPRPCLFLNPHRVDWADDENYAHWQYGEVVPDAGTLIAAVDRAFAEHPRWRAAQETGIARTFLPGGGGARAAIAIAGYLVDAAPLPAAVPGRHGRRRDWRERAAQIVGKARRAALLLPMTLAGWLVHEALEPPASAAATKPFLDRVVASHRTTLIRQGMRSQPEATDYDPHEIRRVTGITLPDLPPGWAVGDTQLYPSTYGDIVQLFLRTPDGTGVSLVAMRIETNAEGQPLLEDRTTERIAYWENGDFAFALVGQLPSARLLQLASQIAVRGTKAEVMSSR
jgi:anti-sigma factor RsiW